MYLPFDALPGIARLWIYQADRPFSDPERAVVERDLLHLCETWTAHGAPLKASFRIEYNQFIILAVDERDAGASGCSIDGSVRMLKEIQRRLQIDFFDRKQVAFLHGNDVVVHPMSRLKTLFENGILNADSITFDHTRVTKSDWEHAWKISARNSWLSRYLPKAAGVRHPS